MRIFHKWLAIVAIPLVLEVLFATSFMWIIHRSEVDVAEHHRAELIQEMLLQTTIVFDEMTFLITEWGFRRGPDIIEQLERKQKTVEQIVSDLKATCDQNNPEQMEAVSKINKMVVGFVEVRENAEQYQRKLKSSISVPEQIRLAVLVKDRMREGGQGVRILNEYRSRLDANNKVQQDLTKQLMHIWVLVAIVGNIVITICLPVFFSRDIVKRINALKENSMRIALGRQLLPSAAGDDEIAEFDEVFHRVVGTLQESFERERANFDNAADAICALDLTGRITRANRAFQEILRYKRDDVLQMHFAEFLDQSSREAWSILIKSASKESQKEEFEARMRTGVGAYKEFLWSIVFEPAENLIMCVGHDITEYKRLERNKQDFVAMLSHDLRGPLTSLGTTFELLANGTYGETSEKLSRTVGRAQDGIKHLISLINELLDLEKLEAGEMDLKVRQVSVNALIQAAIGAVHGSAESKKVTVQTEEVSMKVYADEERLIRVLINLLSNAVKFSDDGSTVRIEASEEDKFVEIRVIDRGPGISEDHLARVFEKYKQISREDYDVKKGSGLGLAICKAIIEAHRGTVGVKSSPGEGATFWLRIPKPEST